MRKAIMTGKAPKPIGPYSQAVIEENFIFVAGQGCTNPATGKLELGDVRSETKRTFENVRAVLEGTATAKQLDELERRDLNTALVTLCIGAGMGTATIIERV